MIKSLILCAITLPSLVWASNSAKNEPISSYEQLQEQVNDMALILQPNATFKIHKKLLRNSSNPLPCSVYFDHATHYTVFQKGKKKWVDLTLGLTYSDGARILAGYRDEQIKETLTEKELEALTIAQEMVNNYTAPNMKRVEKILFLHDALAAHGKYDYEDTTNQSCVSMLVDGTGACGAYTRCMQLLLSMQDIPHRIIQGVNKDGEREPHCWGLVQLDDENWYHLDVTKDDSALNPYQYFCVSDKAMGAAHQWENKDFPVAEETANIGVYQFSDEQSLWTAAMQAYQSGEISFCARLVCPDANQQFSADNIEKQCKSFQIQAIRIITSPLATHPCIYFSFKEDCASLRQIRKEAAKEKE